MGNKNTFVGRVSDYRIDDIPTGSIDTADLITEWVDEQLEREKSAYLGRRAFHIVEFSDWLNAKRRHSPNCAITRWGDIKSWCDCKEEKNII